ncbi:MAG: hypothetical protein J4432_04605 [DPANN group archaeon]|nr:hypothetical protein [DPANN group archaeon]
MIRVLDASAIINSNAYKDDCECVTVQEAIDEIKDFKSRLMVDMAMNLKRLRVFMASKESLKLAEDKAREVGSGKQLSNTDKALMALALDQKKRDAETILITDDFTLQNLAAHLGVKFEGVTRGEIRQKRTFKKQ